MKKKGIATLALAGALAAATMVPAFAANNTTIVGYVAGGNIGGNKVLVTVPKNVTFTAEGDSITGFDVTAKVWNSNTQTWDAPSASGISMGGTVTVTVTSDNNFQLKNGQDTQGQYEYKTTGAAITSGGQVGQLADDAATIAGTVTLTKAPVVAQDGGALEFTDTLTYSFTGGAFGGQ